MDEQRQRNGSLEFYRILSIAADIHDSKSHDYASNQNPYGNYLFAGKLSKLFDNPDDSGFMGRIAEKLYRLANMENNGKSPKNEPIEDTEYDIVVITALWMASRRERRGKNQVNQETNKQVESPKHSEEDKHMYLLHLLQSVVDHLDSIDTRLIKLERDNGNSKPKVQKRKRKA